MKLGVRCAVFTCLAPLWVAQVLNYEDGQGEDSMATIPDVKAPSGDKEDVLGAHSSFRDHRAESEARLNLPKLYADVCFAATGTFAVSMPLQAIKELTNMAAWLALPALCNLCRSLKLQGF